MAHNAKAGGEIGANGEFYKGGQFVADSADTVKGKYLKSSPRKICVEPYKWILADADTFGIYGLIEHCIFINDGWKQMPVEDWYLCCNGKVHEEYNTELLNLYKRGERTINIVDLANLRVRTNAGAYWLNNKLDIREFATIH